MQNIEILEYFIFVDNNDIKLTRYKSLDEVIINAKDYINNIDNKLSKSSTYVGIGADFSKFKDNESSNFGSIDLINRHVGEDKFSFCKDIETLDLKLSPEVKSKLEHLIEVL